MPEDEPITLWTEELRAGEEVAARHIWNHFASKLTDAARKKLAPATRRVYDENDAAQSAFHSLCVGVSDGSFPDLTDRDSLWRLLLVITARKVQHRHRYDAQQCRDINRTSTDSVFLPVEGNSDVKVERFVSREPTPEFTAEFVDSCECLFDKLNDSQLRSIAQLKVEGHTDNEIAAKLSVSRRTVQRRLEMIRRIWTDDQVVE